MEIVDDGYPKELEDTFQLTDGAWLRVRALRRCEERPIRDLFSNLSLRSRYLRFLSPVAALPDSVVRRLACGDYVHQLTLVAEHLDGDAAAVVGVASFGGEGNGEREVALAIRDDWQGRHVGTELARRLLAAAHTRGFDRFTAHVAAGNEPIRRIIGRLATVTSRKVDGAVFELTFEGQVVPVR